MTIQITDDLIATVTEAVIKEYDDTDTKYFEPDGREKHLAEVRRFLMACWLCSSEFDCSHQDILDKLNTDSGIGCWMDTLRDAINQANLPDLHKGFLLGTLEMSRHWLLAEHWHKRRSGAA